MSGYNKIAILLAAPWLGHGRAVEAYLTIVAGVYGALLLFVPDGAFNSQITADIAWLGYGYYLAIPLLGKAALNGAGLIGNIRGNPGSRSLRFVGAMLGTTIWLFLAAKFFLVGAAATAGFSFCLVAILFSIRIMGLALADLPNPGRPGVL